MKLVFLLLDLLKCKTCSPELYIYIYIYIYERVVNKGYRPFLDIRFNGVNIESTALKDYQFPIETKFIHIYIYIYVRRVKLTTVVEGNPTAPFPIAITPKYRKGHYSFPWIASF